MKKNNKLSIIIVHYGTDAEVRKCIESLEISKKWLENVEYIFIDNNEKPSRNLHRYINSLNWLKYTKSPRNLGWGGGRNLGVKYSTGDYYLFLDSDIIIDYKTIKKLLHLISSNKKIGLVAPKIKNVSKLPFPIATRELTPIRGVFYLSFLNKLFHKGSIIQKFLMADWNGKSATKVDVTPLAAFIIRKDAYDSIHGFDENIFLYFEENDLSLDLKKKKWLVYSLPNTKAIHLESKGTPKLRPHVKKIFSHSRYYYFKKHYGILNALLVEFFARISKQTVLIFGILLLSIFLRFYRFMPNFILGGEMGTDYMNIWNMIHGTRTFLLGPRTSHEWFFISPIAYWIYVILFTIWNYNPVAINFFWAVVGIAAVLVSYLVIKKIFNKNIATISSFLLATSPAWIYQIRSSRYNLVVGILFFPYLLYLRDSIKDKGKSLFKLGLILGLTMSFFPSPTLLIPAVIVSFIFYRVMPKFRYILGFILGFLIPNITLLIYEVSNKFAMTTQILSWIPYRVLGFFGLYKKNTVNSTILSENFYSIYHFFTESLAGYDGILPAIIFVFIVVASIVLIVRFYKGRNKKMSFFLLIINLLVSYFGLFIHGNPPEHYYLVIFPIPLILTAYILDKLFKRRYLLIISTLTFGLIGIFGLIKTNWFFIDKEPRSYVVNAVPYTTQLKVTDAIYQNSKGSNFSLMRVGSNDQFENNFANNYIYLLIIRGAKIDNKAKVRYTIIEGSDYYQKAPGLLLFSENDVYVFKTLK